jgi:hypothetical protein
MYTQIQMSSKLNGKMAESRIAFAQLVTAETLPLELSRGTDCELDYTPNKCVS